MDLPQDVLSCKMHDQEKHNVGIAGHKQQPLLSCVRHVPCCHLLRAVGVLALAAAEWMESCSC